MDFKQYVAATERSYEYRVKTAMPLTDVEMDKIERVVLKYDPTDISRPRKTMMQKNPLDFKNVGAAEIYIVDLTLGMPASSYVLQNEIRMALGAPEDHVIVRGYNDPTEVESERLVAADEMAEEADKLGLKPSGLLNDPTYSEVTTPTDLYGAVHNQRFLDALRTVQKERDSARKIDAPNALFKWMDMPKETLDDEGDYNKDIKGAPGLGKAGGSTDDDGTSNQGNLTDRKRTYKRQYGKNGERTMLSREVDTTKAPK